MTATDATDPLLRLACIDSDAPPLFSLLDADGRRHGFEPAVADLVAQRLGRRVEWVPMPWGDMLPAAASHAVDAVLCGQGVTTARAAVAAFTRPYAIFHESVLVRRGSGITTAADLAGLRVAAIDASTNLALAETFEGARPVPFSGDVDDVYGDMLAALAAGDVDVVVVDDVVFVPLGEGHSEFELAFTVQTANRWAIAVAQDRPELRGEIDGALADAIADGSHRQAWEQWMPTLEYPNDLVVSAS